MQNREENDMEITLPSFDYQEKYSTLNDIKKTVEILNEELCQRSKQCCTLELDLVTQMNPRTTQAIKEAKESYEQCKMCIGELTQTAQSNNNQDKLPQTEDEMLTTG